MILIENLKTFRQSLKLIFHFSKMKKIKFNVGSGGTNKDYSWYATDMKNLDITKDKDWRKLLFIFGLDNIMAEHVWEHLTDADMELASLVDMVPEQMIIRFS